MKLKVQVDDGGGAYVAAIDPASGEHRKAASIGKGQELEIELATVTGFDDISFGEVVATGVDAPGGGNEGSPVETPADPPAPGEPPAPDAPPAGEGDQGGGEEPAPSTSAASEKPLYLVDGETQPVGFEASGLETPSGQTLYHFAGDTAGQSATGNADAVSVYADADDNEKPVQPAAPAESSA